MLLQLYKNGATGLTKAEIGETIGCGPGAAGRTAEIYTEEGLDSVAKSGFGLLEHGPYDRSRPQANVMILSTKGIELVEAYLNSLKEK